MTASGFDPFRVTYSAPDSRTNVLGFECTDIYTDSARIITLDAVAQAIGGGYIGFPPSQANWNGLTCSGPSVVVSYNPAGGTPGPPGSDQRGVTVAKTSIVLTTQPQTVSITSNSPLTYSVSGAPYWLGVNSSNGFTTPDILTFQVTNTNCGYCIATITVTGSWTPPEPLSLMFHMPHWHTQPNIFDLHTYPCLQIGAPGPCYLDSQQANVTQEAQLGFSDIAHFLTLVSMPLATVSIGETFTSTVCDSDPVSNSGPQMVAGFNASTLAGQSIIWQPFVNLQNSCFTQSNRQLNANGYQAPYIPALQSGRW
jgi:hypothetical protein